MATLPRSYKTNVPFPFSTSPRKLQEMSLAVPGGHDVTTSSGLSLKQYEEQLNGLRKENFHLKLRIYFLEEKLGSGSPPAVQGLLEHNVRLQVEVEELRRQLTDKQELLAVAAEAIDVLEQQGSMSTDSVEGSMNVSTTVKKELYHPLQEQDNYKTGDETTCHEMELIGDNLGITPMNDDSAELSRLRGENRKALQMIKGCFKKIQQQEKEINKLKKLKETGSTQFNDQTMEKYEEILKCKDEHIKDLEQKVMELQKNIDNYSNDDTTGNLQELLTRRLQGLAYFLDKLLSHKCVLGEDKKKLAESILEQSLALPVGLKLDESMALGDFTMDESNFDASQSFRMEDLTIMFGHHIACGDGVERSSKRHIKLSRADVASESECWSEPDRNVSLARIGLCDPAPGGEESTQEASRQRARRARLPSADPERVEQLARRVRELEAAETEATAALEAERARADGAVEAAAVCERRLAAVEARAAEVEGRAERLRSERRELEETFAETERSLRRAADAATVQASQAALERARAHHRCLQLERDLEEARARLADALDERARLQVEAAATAVRAQEPPCAPERPLSEEDRPTSPDQGIDSDRLSSLEHNDAVSRSPRSLYEENKSLKEKLSRTKETLADTLTQLYSANMRKKNVQRAICREIHKTHGVLLKARDQLEHQTEDCKPLKEL